MIGVHLTTSPSGRIFHYMIKRLILIFAFTSGLSVSSIKAAELFLQIDGVDGDAKEKSYEKHIVADSYQLDFQTRGTFRFAFGKSLDIATVPLMLNGASGKAIKSVVLRVAERAATGRRDIYVVTLEGVTIESVGSSGQSGGGTPRESFSLKYNVVRWDYKAYGADGKLLNTVSAGWHVTENRPL